jgi:hypothetical protein
VQGFATAPDPDPDPVHSDATGLTLGTERPLRHAGGGALLDADNGADVDVQGPGASAVRVDTALLEATAPLLNLANLSRLATAGNTIDLVGQARVNVTGDLITLRNATLNTAGHLVNVAGGSRMLVTGDLVSLFNGAVLNVGTALAPGGAILNVSGGSVVDILGALIRFTGAGNVVNVYNTLAPTTFVGGIPVHVAAGATFTNGIGPAPIAGTGTININGAPLGPGATGSLVAVQGTGGTVKINVPQ